MRIINPQELLIQLPILPANAPSTGTTGIILYSGIFTLFLATAVLLLLKWMRPSASEKLQYRQNDESEAITFLKAQGEQNRCDIVEARKEIASLRQEKQHETDERNDLKNQMHIVLMWCEASYDLILQIKSEWTDMPTHLVSRLDGLKKPGDIFKGKH